MRLPEGAAFEPATREALSAIIANPRDVEIDSLRRFGVSPESFVDRVIETGTATVVRLHGEPVMYFNAAHLPGTDIILYAAGGTPTLDRFPVTFTRCGRELLRTNIEANPDHFHMTVTPPGSVPHRWLNALGFRDSDQVYHGPGGDHLWVVAHMPDAQDA